MSDVRLQNWRLLVPGDEGSLLYLPADGEPLPAATVITRDGASLDAALLSGRRFQGVVAADLAAWASHAGPADPASLLARLARAPGPGGWLYAAFPNALIPGRGRGGLSLAKAIRILEAAGLNATGVYAALPSQRRPAWLIPLARRKELDVFFRRLVFPYAPVSSPTLARILGGVLRAGRRVAAVAPHRLRVRMAPAYAVIGRRPA